MRNLKREEWELTDVPPPDNYKPYHAPSSLGLTAMAIIIVSVIASCLL